MASLAILARQAGISVAGCDVEEEFITDIELRNAGIMVDVGFETKNLEEFIPNGIALQKENARNDTLVIATAAHGGLQNPVVTAAQEVGIEALSYGKALGMFMDGVILDKKFEGISVAGAHGKTTIAAMISFYLFRLGLDPSYVVGTSSIQNLGAAGHYGRGNYFIAEADEYFSDLNFDRIPKFLYQFPNYLIINNIDFDHPDVFPNISELEKAYAEFCANVKSGGIIFANGDDSRVKNILENIPDSIKIITYGVGEDNNYSVSDFCESGLGSTFTINTPQMSIGEFSLSVPGHHNAKNALPVVALLTEFGFEPQKIQEVLPLFRGTKRRIEFIGKTQYGAEIFDDYAHHPQEIKASLQALHDAFPNKKIICIFQSHTYSRTRALLKEFAGSFGAADKLIIIPTFASAREAQDQSGSLELAMREAFQEIRKTAHFMSRESDVVKYVDQQVQSSDYIVVTMGAGFVYKIAEKLIRI